MTIFKDIYKSIFGKGYGAVWKEFAREIQGTYSPISDDRVQFVYKDFTVTFDAHTYYTTVGSSSYEHEYTRGQVDFFSPDSFKLRITQQGFIENLGKLFGGQDIQISNEQFDKRFMVKSNDELKVQLTLSNNLITTSLPDLKTIRLEITDDEGLWGEKPKEGNFMLYYVLDGRVKNIDQLRKLYCLFTESLDTLTKINSIKPITAAMAGRPNLQ